MYRPTIKQLAHEAGVSLGTVSLALNASGPVAVAMARRVRDTASRLGYAPSQAGGCWARAAAE